MPSLVPGLKRTFDEGFSIPNIGLIKGQTYVVSSSIFTLSFH
jgi:hypothetical protein